MGSIKKIEQKSGIRGRGVKAEGRGKE